MSGRDKAPRSLQQNRIMMTIAAIALIPVLLLAVAYISVAQNQWTQEFLAIYDDELGALHERMNETRNVLAEKMQYIKSNRELRNGWSKLTGGSLIEALDYLYLFDGVVNSVTISQNDLSVRCYSRGIPQRYGGYTYMLETLTQEMESAGEETSCAQILNLREEESLWLIRSASRQSMEVEPGLFLYAKVTLSHGDYCILELSLPIRSLVENSLLSSDENQLFVLSLGAGTEQTWFSDKSLAQTLGKQTVLRAIWEHGTDEFTAEYRFLCRTGETFATAFLFPEAAVKMNVRPNIVLFVMIVLLFLIGILAASAYSSRMLTSRILLAVDEMQREIGTLLNQEENTQTPPEQERDEVERVTSQVKRLVQKTKNYVFENAQYKEQHNRLQMELLQMRFNPHFLFNSLASIRYQVRDPLARKSVEHLIHYYQTVLNNGNLIISAERELAMIRDYLEIEKFAYRLEGMTCSIEMQPETEHCAIVKHLLQPIVENALKHGIRANGGIGEIRISARREEDDLIFRVQDNGAGMSRETADALLRRPSSPPESGGYGIYNVQQRIKTYYGEAYGLKIESTQGIGTTVTMVIPARYEPEGSSEYSAREKGRGGECSN